MLYSPVSASPQPGARPAPAVPSRSQTHISHGGQQDEGVQEAPAAPSRGWQRDTTGLSTSHLPPPPSRRDGADGRTGSPAQSSAAPPPYSSAKPRVAPPPVATRGPPPSLPPRLPSRPGTSSAVQAASPAISSRPATQTHMETQGRAENGFLNQSATSRLGAAGISIPGFGIGSKTSAAPPPPSRSPIPSPSAAGPTPASNQGTTWQQKQAALRTASQFNKDPSSISFSDARTAASTANNFRQRHGEQVASGLKTANSLSQRFEATGKAKTGGDSVAGPGTAGQQPQGSISLSTLTSAIGKKKPPAPPPPRKKPTELGSGSASNGNAGAPPPVPMSTRPTF